VSSYRLVSGFRRAGGMARLAGLQVPLPFQSLQSTGLFRIFLGTVASNGAQVQ
jgi:hypothetical protein